MKKVLPEERARLWHALAVVVLLLAGRLAQSIHAAGEGHTVCPEHGEILHVAHAADDGAPSGGGVHGPLVRTARGAYEHDHCWLADWFTSAETSWSPDGSAVCAVANMATRAPAVPRDARHDRSPLSFAPKHSPPVRVL